MHSKKVCCKSRSLGSELTQKGSLNLSAVRWQAPQFQQTYSSQFRNLSFFFPFCPIFTSTISYQLRFRFSLFSQSLHFSLHQDSWLFWIPQKIFLFKCAVLCFSCSAPWHFPIDFLLRSEEKKNLKQLNMYGSQRVLCQICTAVYVPFQVLHFQWAVGETNIIKKHSISSYLIFFHYLKLLMLLFHGFV